MEYTIRYRFHWCGPCEPSGDMKEEALIRSDGSISARRYDHHGPGGHFRLVEKASGLISSEKADSLYEKLMNLVAHHDNFHPMDDADTEIIIEKAGLKISIDGGLGYRKESASGAVEKALESVDLNWQKV